MVPGDAVCGTLRYPGGRSFPSFVGNYLLLTSLPRQKCRGFFCLRLSPFVRRFTRFRKSRHQTDEISVHFLSGSPKTQDVDGYILTGTGYCDILNAFGDVVLPGKTGNGTPYLSVWRPGQSNRCPSYKNARFSENYLRILFSEERICMM